MNAVILKISVGEMIYDVQNKTYLTGKSRRDGSNHEQVATMQANDDDENANQILRSITTAYGTLKTKLSEYLDLTKTTVTNEPLTAETELEVSLKMPSNYNLSTAETLATAVHQFIVATAIAEWFTITDKADAKDYAEQAAESLKVIAEAANKRVRPRRKG